MTGHAGPDAALDAGGPAAAPLTALDAALGTGDPAAAAELQQRATCDPQFLLEMAEHVTFLERVRELRVEPSLRYELLLRGVVRRANERIRRVTPLWRRPWFVVTAAAALWFLLLAWFDPLAHLRPRGDAAAGLGRDVPAAAGVPAGTGTAVAAAPARPPIDPAYETMRDRFELEHSQRLREALRTALDAPGDAIGRWLDPRNAVALMRLDHELRARREVRENALRSEGGLAAADRRVQDLAEVVRHELQRRFGAVPFEPAPSIDEVAFAVRALVAAGPTSVARHEAVTAGARWLERHVGTADTLGRVAALAALVEVAAVGSAEAEAVREHGERLVRDVLFPADATWQRRRPELLTANIAAGTLGEASRLLRLLPAFGVDGRAAGIVRQLLVGSLRERRDRGDDGPEVLAALLYGAADLLPESERTEVELELRRWKPVRLAPDFVTVQQLAWGMEPGRSGYARLQWELRALAAVPQPAGLRSQAALCLGLATSYAVQRGDFLQHVARTTGGM